VRRPSQLLPATGGGQRIGIEREPWCAPVLDDVAAALSIGCDEFVDQVVDGRDVDSTSVLAGSWGIAGRVSQSRSTVPA